MSMSMVVSVMIVIVIIKKQKVDYLTFPSV